LNAVEKEKNNKICRECRGKKRKKGSSTPKKRGGALVLGKNPPFPRGGKKGNAPEKEKKIWGAGGKGGDYFTAVEKGPSWPLIWERGKNLGNGFARKT